jgi:hypothetical protein
MQQHQVSSHVWLSRFAIRFLQIRPEVDWQRAVCRGVSAYARAPYLHPETVAQVIARRAARSHH